MDAVLTLFNRRANFIDLQRRLLKPDLLFLRRNGAAERRVIVNHRDRETRR